NWLAISIPFFLFFMVLEYWIAKKKGRNYFGFANSISNLNIGIAERTLDLAVTGSFFFYYDYLYQHFAFFHFKPGPLHWLSLLLLTDFVWYWYHRLGHEVNILWAAHIVHHQSDDYNFTVSARITLFQALARTGFWSVLPFFGFTAPMITSMLLIHGLYPFFIHTRLIGKLGILEYFMVTPSHHRVHHASNPQYLDKNYGDVLIIWDKLFGTFQVEEEEPVYGLTKPLNSHSFVWQHFHYLLEIGLGLFRVKSFKEGWNLVFGKPEILNPNNRKELETYFQLNPSQYNHKPVLKSYLIGQMVFVLGLLFFLILFEKQVMPMQQWLLSLLIIITLVNSGAVLEQKKWVFYLEYLRLYLVLMLLLMFIPAMGTLLLILVLSGLITIFFKNLENWYHQRDFQ
ncbi:MAG: sterol desaturase family protein, partial [Sediminibacterium sp.]